ncbi:MAG: sensor histidine kinase [Actinophytocola sp.]|nr:sensor histidine kinase [Actinophytocola sp.]
MRRLSLWLHAHPTVGDCVIAAVIALFDIALMIVDDAISDERTNAPVYIELPVLLLTVLPLVIRRRHPLWFAYLVLVIGVGHNALELGVGAIVTGCIAVYTLSVYVGRRHTALYFGLQVAVSLVQIMIQVGAAQWLIVSGFTVGLLVFSWLLGEFVGARRAYQAELEARLHLLETERDQASRIAVAEERSRIARELHDVVAHSVSVIVVHADGAAYAMDGDRDAARRAVHTIADTGREALAELRRLLNVLRDPGAAEGEPLAPQPTIAALRELTDRLTNSGLRVRLDLDGDFAGLPAGVALGVYRIVQESLTNTLKHAGSGAVAEVRVRGAPDAVEVEVTDDGAGKAHPIGLHPLAAVPGGNGLIGMRERAHVFGGTLTVGPRPGGGWQVHAVIPQPETAQEVS